ncbi:hypothetical protein MUTS5_28490 [Escherichia coli]|nr:hypothetical protein EP08_14505 [Escherichia coli]BDY54375.1 hypothetical protein MUTS5_28490 [Escherichia coli]
MPGGLWILWFYGLLFCPVPASRKKPLKGELGEFWRYRVGHFTEVFVKFGIMSWLYLRRLSVTVGKYTIEDCI